MVKSFQRTLLAASLAAGIASCSTTGLGRTWAAPDAQGTSFSKIAVVALTQQEVYRIQAEDALIAEMPKGVASHTLLSGLNALRDTAAAVAALRQAGCDAVVVLRLKSAPVRPDPNAPPPASSSVGQDANDYWVDPAAQETQSFAPGQHFAVDVRLFDLAKNRMVWNGLAIEQGARDAAELVRMVRADVIKDLRARGLISKAN